MKAPPVIVALLVLASSAFVACKREPPDITEEKAKAEAEKEFPKWCDSEGNKCSDFKAKGKQKPIEPDWEWAWAWQNDATSTLMLIQVNKKGLTAMRVQPVETEATPTAAAVPAPGAAASAAAAPAKPAPLAAGAESAAHEIVAQLAQLPGRKGDRHAFKSIQLNPGFWTRLLGSDPELKTKGLPSKVRVGAASLDRRLFGNQLAIDALLKSHPFQKLLAPYSMGTVRPATQAEQEMLQAYFPEIATKPFSLTQEGKDPLLIQDVAGALVLDLLGGYPAPPRKPGAAGAAAVAGSTATVTTPMDEPAKPVGPTFKEVFAACETEIGILCLAAPSSVPQARRCLQPHRAALRTTCGRTVGLKRWP